MRLTELALALAVGLLLAAAWTWPLVTDLTGGVVHPPSLGSGVEAGHHESVWHFWQADETVRRLSEAEGAKDVLVAGGDFRGVADSPTALGLLAVPLTRALGAPLAVNTLLILLLATAFAATYALARFAGCRALAAFAAGLAWAFTPAAVHGSLTSLSALGGPMAPCALLCLLRWMSVGSSSLARLGWAAGAAAALGLEMWIAPHAAIVLAFLGLAAILLAPSLTEEHSGGVRSGLARADALLVFSVVIFLSVLLCVLFGGGAGSAGVSLFAGAARGFPGPAEVLLPPSLNPLLGSPKSFDLAPGFLVVGLAAIGLLRVRRAGRWLLLALAVAPSAWWGIASPERAWSYAVLPLVVVAALFLNQLAVAGRRRLVLALVVGLLFELGVARLPLTSIEPPEAVRKIALLEPGGSARGPGAVCVLGHLGGPHVASSWQTVHGRPALFGPGPVTVGEYERWAQTAPDLHDLMLGGRLPESDALSIDLELQGVDHVILPAPEEGAVLSVYDLMDEVAGFERASTSDGVGWWYRSRLAGAIAELALD